jgi:hypothetical protein
LAFHLLEPQSRLQQAIRGQMLVLIINTPVVLFTPRQQKGNS